MTVLKPYENVLQTLLKEEVDLEFTDFTNDMACQIGTRVLAKAAQENKQIVVDIRKEGELLFYARMNGGSSNNDKWVSWKNNVVHHYGHSSYYMHVFLKSTDSSVEKEGLDPDQYKAEGGAFPLRLKGKGIVGTITVSGLPGEEDHAMVVEVLQELLSNH